MQTWDVVRLAVVAAVCLMAGRGVAAAQTKVCVDIQLRSWADEAPPRPGTPDAGAAEPGQPPAAPGGEEPAPAPQPAEVGAAPDAGEPGPGEATAEPVAPGQAPVAPPPGPVAPGAPGQSPGAPLPPVPPPFQLGQGPVDELDVFDEVQRAGQVPPQPMVTLEPRAYLRRLIEHYVTHRRGFEAVRTGCDERITVELYRLDEGWTAFARYTGHAREEKVDRVLADELDALAQRLTDALLRDVSIEETLTRRNVLRADSESALRTIHGGTAFLLAIGSAMQVGRLPTDDGGTVRQQVRFVAPLSIDLGVRNVYRTWSLDAVAGFRAGTQRRASSRAAAGHADYSFAFDAGLHFLRYLRPDAVSSFYLGGGAGFAAIRYRIIGEHSSEGLWGGGMNVDLVLGQELMRASALGFFIELDLSLPAYVFESESTSGQVDAYLPSAIVRIGLLY